MHFKKIFILTILLLFNCEHKKVDYRSGLLTIYFFQIEPFLNRTAQCSQSNALYIGYGRDNQCIYNRVTTGLIYNANTLSPITSDTLLAGQSFFCQCGSNIAYSIWKRGTTIEDNPSSNPNVTLIFTTPTFSNPNQQALIYKTHYNSPDNLYCATKCPIGSNSFQYQFLKIR